MIDSQDFKVIAEIVFKKERSLIKLEHHYQLTRRQLTYTLEKINFILNEHKIKKIAITGNFIELSTTTNHFLEEYLIHSKMFVEIYPSKEFRQMMLLLILLSATEYLSLDHLIILLMSSKTTIIKDLKIIKHLLQRKKIDLQYSRKTGYFLEGSEEDIRYLLIQKVIYFLNQDNGEMFLKNFVSRYLQADYETFESIIKSLSIKQKISFFDNTLKEFTFCFILLQQRLKTKRVSIQYKVDLLDKNIPEYFFSHKLCSLNQIFLLESQLFITAWTLGLSVGNLDKQTFDKETISTIVYRLVTRFETLAGIRFLDKNTVIKRLYTHLRPSYYRLLFHLPVVNPLTKHIKIEYSKMYSLVKEAIEPLSSLFNSQLPEEEIAYLTIHFAASTFEEREEKTKRNKAIVLCPKGIGTSIILVRELEQLFPNIEFTIQDGHQKLEEEHADIIFATTITTEILSSRIPFIVTNPILNPKEKYDLLGKVYGILNDSTLIDPHVKDLLSVVKKHVSKTQLMNIKNELMYQLGSKQSRVVLEERRTFPLLSEITTPDLISLNIEADNWEEAIRNGTETLVKYHKVLPSYIDGMIETTKDAGPYIVITKHVAMPHARPEEGAKEIAISIATLKKPIIFGNKKNDPVKYIFGLSALDNQSHLTAMAELADLLDQKEFYQLLENATSSQEVFDYIKKFESEEKNNGK